MSLTFDWGRDMNLAELQIESAIARVLPTLPPGTSFEAERMNEIGLYLDEKTGSGFRRILIEPAHPDYGAFLPAPGHGLGFNDLKTIEIKAFLDGVAAGENAEPDLAEAARIGRICEAILDSAASGRWVDRPEEAPSRERTSA